MACFLLFSFWVYVCLGYFIAQIENLWAMTRVVFDTETPPSLVHSKDGMVTGVKPSVNFTKFWLCAPVDGKTIWVSANVSVRMENNKHTITRRTTQVWIKPTNASKFLICIRFFNIKIFSSHTILCMKQHTYALVRFSERISE